MRRSLASLFRLGAAVLLLVGAAQARDAVVVISTSDLLRKELALFSETREPRHLDAAMTHAEHMLLTPAEERREAGREQRLKAMLETLERGRKAIDPRFDPEVALSNYPDWPPPGKPLAVDRPFFFFSGMDPAALPDLETRKDYEVAITEHRAVMDSFRKQYALWRAVDKAKESVRIYLRRAYRAHELSRAHAIIDALVPDAATRERLKTPR